MHSYPGSYESYLAIKKAQTVEMQVQQGSKPTNQQPKPADEGVVSQGTARDSYKLRKEIASTESKIERLEKEIEKINLVFAQQEYGSPVWNEATKKLETTKKQLIELHAHWEDLVAQY